MTDRQDDLKAHVWQGLQQARAVMRSKLDGLSEYDRRRPMVPTGTNLLGLVKHLAGIEYGYLGQSFGRFDFERPTWFRDNPYDEIDMYAEPQESSEYIVASYDAACRHSDETIASRSLDSPARVAHWPVDRQQTTLAALLSRVALETAQHAGHADILRELIDGEAGSSRNPAPAGSERDDLRRAVQAAADPFRVENSADQVL